MERNKYINIKKSSNFLIVGTTRNCEMTLKQSFDTLKSSIGEVKKIQFLFIESDSNDDTKNVLKELSIENENFSYISLGSLINKYPLRTQRLAFCRNVYVKEIRENNKYKHVNYVVVSDLDNINDYLNLTSFESCWERNDWDMCSANQLGVYYDMFALRHKTWMPYDYKILYKSLKKKNPKYKKHLRDILYSRVKTIPANSEWIEVESSFAGLAVYKKECFDKSEYVGLYDDGEEICEHVPFNQKLRKSGAKLFINPRLINANITEHSEPASFWKIMRRKIKEKLVKIFFIKYN